MPQNFPVLHPSSEYNIIRENRLTTITPTIEMIGKLIAAQPLLVLTRVITISEIIIHALSLVSIYFLFIQESFNQIRTHLIQPCRKSKITKHHKTI